MSKNPLETQRYPYRVSEVLIQSRMMTRCPTMKPN